MAQDKKKSIMQIAGENEVLGAPDKPDPDFAAAMKAQQDSVNAALRDDVMFEGNQDPNLRGTGQPGELYMTPGSPEFELKMQKMKDKKDVQAQADSLARRAAEVEIGKNFSIWDIATDLGLEFNPFKKEDKQ